MATGQSAVNYFVSKINQGDLNALDGTRYNYGTTPNTPVAEQNQTYFAYFDGVGGTGPEIIDQTAYSIKYLIDTEGNVVNPEPDTITNRPQAIALYNLLNNFEIGTNAVVKLIESDPILTENPNDDALVGKYPVTHVGRLVLLAASENGIGNNDYITTMSFQEYGTYIQQIEEPFDFSFTAFNQTQTFTEYIFPIFPNTLEAYPVTFTFTNELLPSDFYDGNDEYVFGENTSDYGTQVSFEAAASFNFEMYSVGINTFAKFSYWIEYTEDGSNWVPLTAQQYGPAGIISNTDYRNQGYMESYNGGNRYSTVFSIATSILGNTSPTYSNIIKSYPKAFSIGDRVRVRYQVSAGGLPDETGTYVNLYLNNGANTRFSLVNNSGYITSVTASYFDDISSPTTSPPFLPQSLTASLNFSALINSDYVQILPSSSLAFEYQQPMYSLNIQPGDFIRCEYNPDQVATIVEVTPVDETPSRTCLKVFPPVIPDGATLDHFTIYRIINDGSNIILNVPKPVKGNSFSGVIQPEFVTKELIDKYDKIVVNLTEREIIQ